MVVHKNIIKDAGRILFWFPLRWFVQAVSLRQAQRIGRWLGEIDYRLFGSGRSRKMSSHISEALNISASDARKIVRENLKMNITNTLELMKYPYFTKEELSKSVRFDHLERLDAELKKGKGVILLTAHFGTKQLLQIALGLSGYAVHQLHYHMSSEELSYIQKHVAQTQRKKIESRMPVHFIPADGFLRSAFLCLKNNQILILAGDGIGLKQHMDRSYRGFDFLGKKMLFPTGPYSLARRTQSVILPVFALREEDGRHRIVFEEPIFVGDKDKESLDSTIQYVTLLESYIRRYPRQWEFWEEFDETVLLAEEAAGPGLKDVLNS